MHLTNCIGYVCTMPYCVKEMSNTYFVASVFCYFSYELTLSPQPTNCPLHNNISLGCVVDSAQCLIV